MRASHVIKGAASNLMCDELRTAAMHLEQAASAAHDLKNHATQAQQQNVFGSATQPQNVFGSSTSAQNVFGSVTQAQQANELDPSSTQQGQQVMGNVQARYMELKVAVANYHAFLNSISV
jgi:HPt (histidine-containing phosphotransfer) domain-containing protein